MDVGVFRHRKEGKVMGLLIIASYLAFLTLVDIWIVNKVLSNETDQQLLRGKVSRIESNQRINNMRLIDTEILKHR